MFRELNLFLYYFMQKTEYHDLESKVPFFGFISLLKKKSRLEIWYLMMLYQRLVYIKTYGLLCGV